MLKGKILFWVPGVQSSIMASCGPLAVLTQLSAHDSHWQAYVSKTWAGTNQIAQLLQSGLLKKYTTHSPNKHYIHVCTCNITKNYQFKHVNQIKLISLHDKVALHIT